MLAGVSETLLHFFPVHNVPEGLDVVALDVLVLEVEGVLPHVEEEQRDEGEGVVVLGAVGDLLDHQALGEHIPGEDGPAGALDAGGGCVEFLLELLEGAEALIDSGGQLAFGAAVLLGGQVLPEEGVVDVSTEVEGEVLGDRGDLVLRVAGLAGFLKSPRAALAPETYPAWCLSWWSSMISPAMNGSRAL